MITGKCFRTDEEMKVLLKCFDVNGSDPHSLPALHWNWLTHGIGSEVRIWGLMAKGQNPLFGKRKL